MAKFAKSVQSQLTTQTFVIFDIFQKTSDMFFQSRNGRWRSQWTVLMSGGQAEVSGVLKVQVHYYEDGNVQLVSSKEVKETINIDVSYIRCKLSLMMPNLTDRLGRLAFI